jgi:4-amino-4-deoxy-L-arabinose transferase-like glycosyltransferase
VIRRDAARRWKVWQRASWTERLPIILHSLVCLSAVIAIGQVTIAMTNRCTYPFELEWMEGAVVDHVRCVLSGQALYHAPGIAFTPYIYTPFYYGVSALVCRVIGVGFLGPRLVSVLAALGSMMLIGSFVRRETDDRTAPVVAVGWFAATYELTGFWLDIARVDSLFLFLTLAGTWLARFGRWRGSALGAGAVLFLAFFTKQTGLVLAAPAIAFSFARGWKRGASTFATFALLTTAVVVWMNRVSDGWFSFYVFEVPGQHQLLWDRWRPLLVEFFWTPVAVPMLLAVLVFLSPRAPLRGWGLWTSYLLLALVALLGSYSSLLHKDGFVNVLIPGYAVLAILAGIGWAWTQQHSSEPDSARIRRLRSAASVAMLLAFAVLAYDHRRAIPSNHDEAATQAMIAELGTQQGPILMLGTGYYGALAGHDEISANAMALADVFKTMDGPRKALLRKELLDTIASRRYPAIVMSNSLTLLPPEIGNAVRKHYQLKTKMYAGSAAHAGWPRTGFRNRPEEIWVPRQPGTH